MASNLIEKLLAEAVRSKGTYAEFCVSEENVAFICNGGSRRSTRNYRRTKTEIIADERVLKAINEKNLLFAETLNRISITLVDGRTAIFQRHDNDYFSTINARKVNESKEKAYEYVCFKSEQKPSTGIAFAIKSGKNGKRQIMPCEGVILNGPNTSGIQTGLQFVISADLRTIDNTLIDEDDKANREAVDELSSVMQRAIKEMLHLGLLGMPLFAVLPNTMDEESVINTALIQAVRNVCNSYPLFKNKVGTIVGKNNIAYGTDEVTSLFPQNLAKAFLGERYWIEPCVAESREEYFLIDIGIPYYDRERFLKELFLEENLDDCSRILAEQNDRWLRAFYLFVAAPIAEESIKRHVISGLRNIRSIRDIKGTMKYPYEVSLVTNGTNASKRSAVIKPGIISPGGVDDEHSAQLRFFFLSDLGIKEYSQKPEMEELAQSLMTKKQAVDRVYVEKLLTLAKYDEARPGEIDFRAFAIFPYESTRGIRRVEASELVIGKPYIREGNLLASATGRKSIWKGFKKLLGEDELQTILAFVERCGAIGLPKITRQAANEHRDYSKKLWSDGKQGVRDTNYDFTIPGLDDLLKRRSLQLSKMVWDALLEKSIDTDVLFAEYSVNNRAIVNRCDSSLILSLRERTWVPGKDGRFYMPENIAVSDVHEDFVFDKKNSVLKALHFGEGIKKKEKAIKEMEKLAAKEGLRIISEEEYQQFLEWKRIKSL